MKTLAKVIGRTMGLSVLAVIMGGLIIRCGNSAYQNWVKYNNMHVRAMLYNPNIIHQPNANGYNYDHVMNGYLHHALLWTALTVACLGLLALIRPLRLRRV